MSATRWWNAWRYLAPLLAPMVLVALVVLTLREPLAWWLQGEEKSDRDNIKEWLWEAGDAGTLPELVREYLDQVDRERQRLKKDGKAPGQVGQIDLASQTLEIMESKIRVHLKTLGDPTRMYPRHLPLFPVIFRLSVQFRSELRPIVWDSKLRPQENQYRELTMDLLDPRGATVTVQYHLHAYTLRQAQERQEATRRLWLSGLGGLFAVVALVWLYVIQRRERERHRRHALAEHQVSEAKRQRLEEELRRQEAERQKEEAERQALELKSQLFANIGIMAGSYAHNIKNLLVRPNDLLRRCLEDRSAGDDQAHMLSEVRETLGTVTERLQQILQTVRRDPNRSERTRLDLNALAADMQRTWADLAREKWKLAIELELNPRDALGRPEPLWIEGDLSHLQQAVENLVFNARDSTFEMRNYLRDQARRGTDTMGRSPSASTDGLAVDPRPVDAEMRQALIAAAAWKGVVRLCTRQTGSEAILEVEDNGIGMSDDVRRRCLETHFSTKRNNALFAGLSAGMGLGLSFVTVILGHHGAILEIDSRPLQGAVFRVRFPLAAPVTVER